MGVAGSQGVGVGKNWVLGISVGINREAGRVRRVEGTGSFVRFVFKGRVCRGVVVHETDVVLVSVLAQCLDLACLALVYSMCLQNFAYFLPSLKDLLVKFFLCLLAHRSHFCGEGFLCR